MFTVMDKPRHRLIAWIIRLIIYPIGFFFALKYLYPLGFVGLLLAGPSAAIVIGLDLFITSKLRGQTVGQAFAVRLLYVDKQISPAGESALGQLGAARKSEGLTRKPEAEIEGGDDVS